MRRYVIAVIAVLALAVPAPAGAAMSPVACQHSHVAWKFRVCEMPVEAVV